MAKARKSAAKRKTKKPIYLSAKQLGILPEERKALIAFVNAPALGNNIAMNGHAHHYNQGTAESDDLAEKNECGTAGCVAGFVFAHATVIQGLRSLHGQVTADGYMNSCGDILDGLYCEGNQDIRLALARRVVDHMLKTGEVDWRGEF